MQELTTDLIIDIQNGIGILKLNRPEKLNCLNYSIIEKLAKILDEWKDGSRIEHVVLQGKGRAFCAGGDVVALVEAWNKGDKGAADFFEKEYEVDGKIATYPKPLSVFGHGAVMGGGIGLLQGARFRYLDPDALLAMPEVTIGLFPDVGASYFLNQLPHCWGFLLGLTGMRLSAGVAVVLGLADGLISKDQWPRALGAIGDREDLDEYLIAPTAQDREFVEDVQREMSDFFPWPGLKEFDQFARGYKGVAALEKAFAQYLNGSPTSAAVIERQLLRGQELTLEEAYAKEAKMARAFMVQNDFREGVRALLIDKDQKPRWSPARLAEVTPEHINQHFN